MLSAELSSNVQHNLQHKGHICRKNNGTTVSTKQHKECTGESDFSEEMIRGCEEGARASKETPSARVTLIMPPPGPVPTSAQVGQSVMLPKKMLSERSPLAFARMLHRREAPNGVIISTLSELCHSGQSARAVRQRHHDGSD